MVLSISNLDVEFNVHEGTAHVLDGVSLDIGENEIVALVGESGSGKSVTAKSILGTLQQPPGRITGGSIEFEGQDLFSLSQEEHADLRGTEIGMVPQDPLSGLNPVYTIGEQLTDLIRWQDTNKVGVVRYLRDKLRRNDDAPRETAIEVLDQVQIPDPEAILGRYPVELSGGMRQRVLIAMALVGDPKLLIADEPTTALDVTITNQILEVLETRVRDEGLGVLYITHNLGIAYQISDRVAVMYGGRIVETGPTEEIFDTPKHPYTQGLLDSVPSLDLGVGRGMEGEVPDYTSPPKGCRFHPRCPEATDECRRYTPVLATNAKNNGITDRTEAARIERESAHSGDQAVACFLYDEVPRTEVQADE